MNHYIYIPIVVALAVVLFSFYLRYRRLKLILRNFLHDLNNYLMSFSIFHESYTLGQNKCNFQEMAEENRLTYYRMKTCIEGFMAYLEKGENWQVMDRDIELNDFLHQKEVEINKCVLKKRFKWDFIITEKPIKLKANPYLLNGMIDNLICNAIKYTKNEGKVSIQLKEMGKKGRLIIQNEKSENPRKKFRKSQGLHFVKKISPQIRSKIALDAEGDFYTVTCDFHRASQ